MSHIVARRSRWCPSLGLGKQVQQGQSHTKKDGDKIRGKTVGRKGVVTLTLPSHSPKYELALPADEYTARLAPSEFSYAARCHVNIPDHGLLDLSFMSGHWNPTSGLAKKLWNIAECTGRSRGCLLQTASTLHPDIELPTSTTFHPPWPQLPLHCLKSNTPLTITLRRNTMMSLVYRSSDTSQWLRTTSICPTSSWFSDHGHGRATAGGWLEQSLAPLSLRVDTK